LGEWKVAEATELPPGKANIVPTNTSQQKPTADTWPELTAAEAQSEKII